MSSHKVVKNSSRTYLNALVLSLMFSVVIVAYGETLLDVKIKKCERGEESQVVCDFKMKSGVSASMSLTGGEYSQAVDGNGTAYDSTQVSVEGVSGLAVNFKIFRGSQWIPGKIYFDDVDDEVNKFEIMTMRFNDGNWIQEKTISIHQ